MRRVGRKRSTLVLLFRTLRNFSSYMFSPIAIYMGSKFFRIHIANFSGSNAEVIANFSESIAYHEIDKIKVDRREMPGSP